MTPADKIFEAFYAHSDGTQSREQSRAEFDAAMDANKKIKELIATCNVTSFRVVNLVSESHV